MSVDLSPVTGPEKRDIVSRALQTPDFRAYREYFAQQRGYRFLRTQVTSVDHDDGDSPDYVVSYLLDDDRPTTRAEINLLLDGDTLVSSDVTIDHREGGDIVEAESYRFEDGDVVLVE